MTDKEESYRNTEVYAPAKIIGLHGEKVYKIRADIRKLPRGTFGHKGASYVAKIGSVEYSVSNSSGEWKVIDADNWLYEGKWCQKQKAEK